MDIELARAQDEPELTATLALSFVDDPGLGWIWPDRDDRIARLPWFFRPIVLGTLANGIGFRREVGDAVALLRRPGRTVPGQEEFHDGMADMVKAFERGAERSAVMSETLRRHHPAGDDWWYLQFIGVQPGVQGHGSGSAVLNAALRRVRALGQRVHVEVMNPRNLDFYRHAGFRPVAEFDIPEDGPHVWTMLYDG